MIRAMMSLVASLALFPLALIGFVVALPVCCVIVVAAINACLWLGVFASIALALWCALPVMLSPFVALLIIAMMCILCVRKLARWGCDD